MLLISVLACATCADKVPNGVIILIGSIGLVVLLSCVIGKVISKIKQVRRVKNASV